MKKLKTSKRKAVKLTTLRKTTWDKIKVGEVFAYEGCWTVAVKTGDNKAMVLDCDERREGENVHYSNPGQEAGKEYTLGLVFSPILCEKTPIFKRNEMFSYALTKSPLSEQSEGYHKLPVSVQRLWRQD